MHKNIQELVKIVIVMWMLVEERVSQCVMSQTCSNPQDSSTCTIPFKDLRAPSIQPTIDSICPMFKGQPVCCNSDQITELEVNFNLIDYIFGDLGGGCDICSSNIKQFWCYYTCSPQQEDFVQVGNNINVIQDNVEYKVVNVSMYVAPETAVDIYQSCSKVQKVTLTTPMQSAAGLLNFLGSNSVKAGKSLINVYYQTMGQQVKPLNIKSELCNTTYPNGTTHDTLGFPFTKNCSCNNCQQMCHNNFDFSAKKSSLEGLNWWLVFFIYLGIAFLTFITNFIRAKMKKERVRTRSASINNSNIMNNTDEVIKLVKNEKINGDLSLKLMK